MTDRDAKTQPAGWLEGPHGAFRANLLCRIEAPQSAVWAVALYPALPPAPLRAVSAYYSLYAREVIVMLPGQIKLSFPPGMVKGLHNVNGDDLCSIELVDGGVGLRIERLDVDISIADLLTPAHGIGGKT